MTVYNVSGQEQIAFVNSAVRFTLTATFVASLGPLNPPLPSGLAILRIPRDCTIKKVSLLTTGGTGSCVVDIYKDVYSAYPPTAGDTICGASKPTIISGVKYEDSTLTGWSPNLSAGDVLGINLDSSTTFTKVVAILELE